MEKPAHTPLPWRITEANEKKTKEIVGANGATIARLTALDMPNAELIVAAVNACAALKPVGEVMDLFVGLGIRSGTAMWFKEAPPEGTKLYAAAEQE